MTGHRQPMRVALAALAVSCVVGVLSPLSASAATRGAGQGGDGRLQVATAQVTVAPPTPPAPTPPLPPPALPTKPAPPSPTPSLPPSPLATAPAATMPPATATAAPATATATLAPPTDTPTAPPTATPTASGAAPPTATIHAGGRVQVSPERIAPGASVEVAAVDFGERERLSVWLSDAAGVVTALSEQTTTRDGQAYFVIMTPAEAAHGPAAVTVQGQTSRRRAVATFVVDRGNTPEDDAGEDAPTATTPAITPVATGTAHASEPATPTVTPTATATATRTATVTPTPTPDNRDIAGLLPPGPPGGALSPRLARTYFGNAARISGVPVEVLLAVAAVESGFRPNAVGPYLPQFAGTIDEHALGMMQFLPSTYQYYVRRVDRLTGKNLGLRGLWDPESAVYAAALYLSDSGAPGDMRRALYRYNNADWYVRLVLAWADYYARGGTIGGAPVVDLARLPDLPSPTQASASATPHVQAAAPPSLADAHLPRLSALPEGLLELLGQVHDRLGWPKLQVETRPLPN